MVISCLVVHELAAPIELRRIKARQPGAVQLSSRDREPPMHGGKQAADPVTGQPRPNKPANLPAPPPRHAPGTQREKKRVANPDQMYAGVCYCPVKLSMHQIPRCWAC